MARRFKPAINHHSEFELDLAPLLAVMVKLVPVLLVSSAFVQMMIVETELPQVVQQAIEKQDQNPKAAQIVVDINKKEGIKITITDQGQQKIELIGLKPDRQFDLQALQTKFLEIKQAHPEVFKIEMNPDADVAYKDIVKIMDEARRVRSGGTRFTIKDEKTGKETTTDFMFPEVVLANVMDG